MGAKAKNVMKMDYSALAEQLLPIGWEAAEILMKFHGEHIAVQHKSDASPVSEADHAAHDFLINALHEITSEIPIISEEDDCHAAPTERFWLLDPLDGTKSFLRGKEEFVISLGLIEAEKAVFGFIVVPTEQVTYWGASGNAWKVHKREKPESIQCRPTQKGDRLALVSHFHREGRTSEHLKREGIEQHQAMSSALKFCRLAEGNADYVLRYGPTMEWDTAGGQAIVEAAGGTMLTVEGEPFRYGKPAYKNGGFIASGPTG